MEESSKEDLEEEIEEVADVKDCFELSFGMFNLTLKSKTYDVKELAELSSVFITRHFPSILNNKNGKTKSYIS